MYFALESISAGGNRVRYVYKKNKRDCIFTNGISGQVQNSQISQEYFEIVQPSK